MPKIVDHDERRSEIADAATKVVVRVGFDRLTMREIASEVGCTHGALARYFPTKQSLLTAAFVRLCERANERILARVEGVRGLEALRRMCEEVLPFGEIGPLYSRVVLSFWAHGSQDDEVRAVHHLNNMRWRDMFRRFLTEAREDGELAGDIDIETAVGEVAARNAGWQMISVLQPEVAGDSRMARGLDALIREFRAG